MTDDSEADVPIQVYIVRQADDAWQVRLRRQIVGSERTEMQAYRAAEALAQAGALRGERSKILVADLDGQFVEFPEIRPAPLRA